MRRWTVTVEISGSETYTVLAGDRATAQTRARELCREALADDEIYLNLDCIVGTAWPVARAAGGAGTC